MEYHEAAAALQSLQRHRPKLGVGTTKRMLSALGGPQDGVEFVQIAGSNGKGSTARMLESVLREAGMSVGLFTSPALTDVRDQIRIDGRQIGKEAVAAFIEEIDPCLERLRAEDDVPTHFEVLTALAISHMGREGVDVGILEVGIGGRYDATSAVDPVASAVTSVSLEHTDLLGDTVEEIARDKAQVAPSTGPLVTGATGPALAAIREETATVTVGPEGADVRAVETGMASRVESRVSLEGPGWALETNLSLLGQHQATNAGVAATLAREVADVDPATIADGLRNATWPGRFEILGTEPLVVLDGAHNPGAAATLAELVARYDYDDLHLVFAAMSDKDHDGMAARLPPVDTAFLTRPDHDRAASPAALAAALEGRAERTHRIESVQEATERALSTAGPADVVLVTGSLYAVAEARDRWTRPPVPKDRGREPAPDALFAGATFPEAAPERVGTRVFATTLRRPQADRLEAALEAVGAQSVRSRAGTPADYARTVAGGTGAQLRALLEELRGAGLGLGRVADRLEALLADEPGPSPFSGSGPALLGVLNVTPDSFHDGGQYREREAAVARAREMVAAGADAIDVGGESTRPGADPVPAATEIDRVVPVIEAVSSLGVPVSVDTRKAAVADAALEAGATVVNDVSGLEDPEMRFVVADHDASLVVMHSLGAPVDPGRTGRYDDVVDDVRRDLTELVLHAERAGLDRDQLVVDPGCGFGKTPAESFELIRRLGEFRALGCPVMAGHSHKSMFDAVGCGPGKRGPPTLAATALAAAGGADVVRVHDVAATAAVLRTVEALGW